MLTPSSTIGSAAASVSPARTSVLGALYAGLAASVPTVPLAVLGTLFTPHVRGLGFYPELRYALVAPACVSFAVLAALFYRVAFGTVARPRLTLMAALLVTATSLLALLYATGPEGLARGAALAIFVAAFALALLIPRRTERPARLLGVVVLSLFGALELVGVAAALASEPAHAQPPELTRTQFDAEHKYLTLATGERIHYVDEGEGETLLFLHGNPAWSFQWRELIAQLRGTYRCVALDYPGFGWSRAPAGFGYTPREESRVVEEFVSRLGLRDVTLVMQDWGGPIGLGFAGRHPELVKRVVLGSTWAWPTDTSVPRGKFSVIMGGPLGEFLQVNFNAFARLGLENGIVKTLDPAVLALYLQPFRPLTARGIAAFYPGQINAASAYFREVEAGLTKLQAKPALIFWAGLDRGFPAADRERFERTFPNHRTVPLPEANHFFFEDAAAQMVPELRAFVQ